MFNISFQELCMLINNLQNVWSSAIVIRHRLLAMTLTNRTRRKNILHLMNENNVLRSMIKKKREGKKGRLWIRPGRSFPTMNSKQQKKFLPSPHFTLQCVAVASKSLRKTQAIRYKCEQSFEACGRVSITVHIIPDSFSCRHENLSDINVNMV